MRPWTTRLLAACSAALAALAASTATVSAASPYGGTSVNASDVAALLTPRPADDDITYASRAPRGDWIVFRLREHRSYDYGPGGSYPWTCADNWVMRSDGRDRARLTTSCDYGEPYSHGQSAAGWLVDGSIVAFYASPVDHQGGGTSRWLLDRSARTASWQPTTGFRGYAEAVTDDGRFLAIRQPEWAYSNTYWWALDLATGAKHLVWDEQHQGDGRWTEACASAPSRGPFGPPPAVAEILAVLSGPDPACTFARQVKPLANVPAAGESDSPTADLAVASPPGETKPLTETAGGASALPAPNPLAALLSIDAATQQPARAVRRGFTVKVTAARAGTLKVWVLAERTEKSPVTLARTSRETPAGRASAVLLLSAKAKAQLRSTTRIRMRAALTAADGTRTVQERAFQLFP